MNTQDEVIVDDDGNIINQAPAPEEKPEGEEPATSQTEASDEDHDDDEEGDERLNGESEAGDENDPEREAIRERRREEKKRRRVSHREKEDRLRRELAARDELLAQQQQRLDAIERRNQGSEVAQLDAALKQSVDAYNFFKGKVKEATDAADGATMTEAMEKMMLAKQRAEEIHKIKQAYGQRQEAPQPLDPRLKAHAEGWMQRNSWYDPNGKDPDSKIALTLDQSLVEEGFNPTTDAYWQELDARVRKYLPHRAKPGYNVGTTKPRSVVAGSGNSTASAPGSSAGYRLSPERVQAIKDSGAWDDPKARAEMIKRYREYDKQHQQG